MNYTSQSTLAATGGVMATFWGVSVWWVALGLVIAGVSIFLLACNSRKAKAEALMDGADN